MLGNEKRPVYLNVGKDGKICKKTDTGTESFNFMEGRLIRIRTATVRSELFGKTDKLILEFEDEGEKYALSMGLHTGHARSIVLSLANIERFGIIRISTWKRDEWIRASVCNDGEPVDWAAEMPAVETDNAGIRDTTARDTFIDSLISGIQARLQAHPEPVPSGVDTFITTTVRAVRAAASVPGPITDDDVPF